MILRRSFWRLPNPSLEASVTLSPLLQRSLSSPSSSPINPSISRREKKNRREERVEIKRRAAMIAFRPVSKLLEELRFSPIRSAVAPFRSFSTETRNLAGDTKSLDIDRGTDVSRAPRRRRRRRGGGDLFPSFFSDAFDPFNPARSLSQLLNLMDRTAESPFAAVTGRRRGWDAREEEDALYLSVEMPGLGKEDVSVTVEQSTLVIMGEGGEEEGKGEEEGTVRRRYSSRIDLPPNFYKMDGITAEMKNGVLKVVVPKVKDEERKDVVRVQIE